MVRLRELAMGPYLRYVETRASRIEDPIERLRYLRQMTAVPLSRRSISASRAFRWSFVVVAVLVILMMPWRRPPAAVTTNAATMKTAPSVSISGLPRTDQIWLVDQQRQFEVYSNGLRIERTYETPNYPRRYLIFPEPDRGVKPKQGKEPIGIVFHTTESRLAPFESKHNESLRRFGIGLVRFAQQHKLYHYVVDRFGRIYRVVEEGHAANHAGFSAWSKDGDVYVKLNMSFLGVAFEGRSTAFGEELTINEAQIHSAKLLADWLRFKYKIEPANCATHAQVSVSPTAGKIGYHQDWSANFPFEAIGLPNNYKIVLPSLRLFGYEYDPEYYDAAAPELQTALKQGEGELERNARSGSITLERHRGILQKRFMKYSQAMREYTIAQGDKGNVEEGE